MSKVKLYIETSPLVYELLDTFGTEENINISYKLKDSSDLAKAFSVYSQSFSIPADKNNRKLDFYFNTKVSRNTKISFNAKLYIGTQLFKVGSILIGPGKFKNDKIFSYSVTFTTALKSFKDSVGDVTLTQLDSLGGVYSGVTFNWSDSNVYNHLSNSSVTGASVMVPLISMERVWTFNDMGANDIKYSAGTIPPITNTTTSAHYVDKKELRPSIPFSYVIDRIAQNFGFEFVIPMKGERAYDNLAIHLTGNQTNSVNATLPYTDGFFQYQPGFSAPALTNWILQPSGTAGEVYSLEKTSTLTSQSGFFSQAFTPKSSLGLAASDTPISAKFRYIDMRPASIGTVLYEQTVAANPDSANSIWATTVFSETKFGTNPLVVPITPTAPLLFKVEVEMSTICEWTDGQYSIWVYDNDAQYNYYLYGSFDNYAEMNTIALLKSLPSMKVSDFVSNFVKLFNLRIRQDNANNKKLYFERPQEWYNKTLDYTRYADISDYSMESNTLYKDYDFKHYTSKYIGNVNYAVANVNNPIGKEFGESTLKITGDTLTSSYKLETSSTITPQVLLNTQFATSYGFNNDKPSAGVPAYGSLYKPNLGELTLFYNGGPVDMGSDFQFAFKIGSAKSATTEVNRFSISDIDETDITSQRYKRMNYSNSLGFSPTVDVLRSVGLDFNLYSNHYDDTISRLNAPNGRIKTITCWLPSFELTNFDLRNNIIIGDQIHSIEEAALNLVSGKATLKLLNYTEPNAGVWFNTNGSAFSYSFLGVPGFVLNMTGFDSTYKIDRYEMNIDGVIQPDVHTSEKWFNINLSNSNVGKTIYITIVDIYGNRSLVSSYHLNG